MLRLQTIFLLLLILPSMANAPLSYLKGSYIPTICVIHCSGWWNQTSSHFMSPQTMWMQCLRNTAEIQSHQTWYYTITIVPLPSSGGNMVQQSCRNTPTSLTAASSARTSMETIMCLSNCDTTLHSPSQLAPWWDSGCPWAPLGSAFSIWSGHILSVELSNYLISCIWILLSKY